MLRAVWNWSSQCYIPVHGWLIDFIDAAPVSCTIPDVRDSPLAMVHLERAVDRFLTLSISYRDEMTLHYF